MKKTEQDLNSTASERFRNKLEVTSFSYFLNNPTRGAKAIAKNSGNKITEQEVHDAWHEARTKYRQITRQKEVFIDILVKKFESHKK